MLNFGPQAVPLYQTFLAIVADEQGDGSGRKYAFDVPGVVPMKSYHIPSPTNKGSGITDVSWSAAYPLIVDWLHAHFGDTGVVRAHYNRTRQFMQGLFQQARARNVSNALPEFWTWGDWCTAQDRAGATPATGPPAAAFNYILSLDAMGRMATALGLAGDATHWKTMGMAERKLWHAQFYDPEHKAYGYYGDGHEDDFVLQTLTAAPLAMGQVIPDALQAGVLQSFAGDFAARDFHVTFGSVGAKHVIPQLSAHGMHATALSVATQTTYPSFLYWASKGATTCWENWSGVADAAHPPQPTHNHIFLCGGVGEWMYRDVAGIRAEAPGYQRVVVRPQVVAEVGPASASASVQTPYGRVAANWTRSLSSSSSSSFSSAARTLVSLRVAVELPKPGRVELPVPSDQTPATVEVTCCGGVTVWKGGCAAAAGRQAALPPGVVSVSTRSAADAADGTARIAVEVERGMYGFLLQPVAGLN